MFWITLTVSILVTDLVKCVPDDTFEVDLSDKTTWQSSVFTDSTKSYPSDLAVDGCLKPYFSFGCCSSTDTVDDAYPWWSVDLGEKYTVVSVGLANRADKKGDKLTQFHVYGSNTSHNPSEDPYKQTCAYRGDPIAEGSTEYLDCEKDFRARYVIIQKSDKELTLCEVIVLAECPYNTFGSNCEDCPINCAYPPCDRTSAACIGGCLDGYTGSTCTRECPANTFGRECQPCSANCQTQPCDIDTGACTDGECTPGYQGENCSQECPSGRYGAQCLSTCSDNCKGASCRHVNGICHQGCEDGWTGDMCDREQSSLSSGEIAAIVVVSLLVIIGGVIAVVVFIVIKRRRNYKNSLEAVTMSKPETTTRCQGTGDAYEHPVRTTQDTEHNYTAVY